MDPNILRFAAALGIESMPDHTDFIGVCTLEGLNGDVYFYDRDPDSNWPGSDSGSAAVPDLVLWAPSDHIANYPLRLPNNVGLPDHDFDPDVWFEFQGLFRVLDGEICANYKRTYSPLWPRDPNRDEQLHVALISSPTGLVVDLAIEWRGTAAEFLAIGWERGIEPSALRARVDALHLGRRVVAISKDASGGSYLIRWEN